MIDRISELNIIRDIIIDYDYDKKVKYLKYLKSEFEVLFTYHSNRIEGTNTTLTLNDTRNIISNTYNKDSVVEINKLRDIGNITVGFKDSEFIEKSYISNVDTSLGEVTIQLDATSGLYSKILNDIIGTDISSKASLMKMFQELTVAKKEYDQVKGALKMVKQTGYGIAAPTLADMKLETPEIIKQGSRYGVKLKARAPSIHMIKVEVESTFEPIIGSELQSKELINYLTKDTNSENIWKSEIFGRSLDVIVQEGIQAKLSMMPDTIRYKLGQTLTKVINKGSNNMIAIVI